MHKLSLSPGDSSKILIHLKKQRTGEESGQCTLLLMISVSEITHTHAHIIGIHTYSICKNGNRGTLVSTGPRTTLCETRMCADQKNTCAHTLLIKTVQYVFVTSSSALACPSIAGKQAGVWSQFSLGVNEGRPGSMIQTQQSRLITAHFNKENAGLWRSSFIMLACHIMYPQQ